VTAAAPAQARPLALGGHVADAARSAAYLAAGLGLGVLALLAVLGGRDAVARVAELERRVANRLLTARIAAPPPVTSTPIEWRKAALLAAKLPLTAVAAAWPALPALLLVWLLVHAGEAFAGSDAYLGPWRLATPLGIVLLLLAVPAFLLACGALSASGSALARLDRRLLAPPPTSAEAVREVLAERLGDRTLAIAYWLPERELFVDEHGRPVELPERGSGRSWTAVAHDGRRVAAIIHDAELPARPELVEAAAAGAVLALDNERLKADLRARLEELRASRKRIIEASVEARRKFERDLHDGAQQQLVAVSLDLQLIRSATREQETKELLDETIARLSSALAELRELARGIHPAVLSERGLLPALEALAERTPLPVELEVSIGRRLSPAIEAAAYFVAAEALTNVAKYAHASRARLRAVHADGTLTIEVADDGVGGADPARGSGLRGLADRISAIDGTLAIESPAGAGTRVVVTVPAGEPEAEEP